MILPGLVFPFVILEKFEEKNELLLSCSNIEAGFCGFSNNDSKKIINIKQIYYLIE